MDVDAVFCRDFWRIHCRQANHVFDLVLDLLGSCRRQINLVDYRQNLQPVVDCEIGVCQRLRLNALRGVNDQHCAFAGGQAARDLVVEVHVTRRVDEVQNIVLPVVCTIIEPDGARLDGDAALALEVHGVQDLVLHLALVDSVALLQKPVGKGRLAVVDVRDDGKITNLGKVGHRTLPLSNRINARVCSFNW